MTTKSIKSVVATSKLASQPKDIVANASSGNPVTLVKVVSPDGNGGSEAKQPKPPAPAPTQAPAAPAVMTLEERIQRVENLQLVVNKRGKLVQTRSELEKFQIASNDFNCQMQLKDSDGNTFTTSFTPGIKKVIEFLKGSFDQSIRDVESQIKF